MRCYFNDEWAGCSFGVWFTPQTFTINPNDKFNAPIVMVDDDNKYLRHYGMKFTCDGTNWFALIGADNNTISRFNIVEVVGVLRV
jgi:hypothetical protein